MNIQERLLQEHTRRQADRIASWIGPDPRRFRELMQVFLTGDPLLTQRSAWVVSICAERHPRLSGPWLRPMIARMLEPGIHGAVPRAVVRILQSAEIPHDLLGKVASVCFDQLASGTAGVAVKAFAMTVLARIAQGRPDLGRELRMVIEQQLPFASAGFAARARMVLKRMKA